MTGDAQHPAGAGPARHPAGRVKGAGAAGAAAVTADGWRALRQTLGVAAISEYDQVLLTAREQLDRLGYVAPQPVSWRWGTLVVEAGPLDAARLRLDAARLCAAIVGALPAGGVPPVSRLEVRVVR
jgi:hypothetical protein